MIGDSAEGSMTARRVAIIGSFRQHYAAVLAAHVSFKEAGLEITSPKGDPIITPGIDFVRFTSDPVLADDPMVQTIALHRILRADFVYVVAPNGYAGRTTCYEVGRVVQAGRPLYFSEQPNDLPLRIPSSHVLTARQVAEQVQKGDFRPTRIFGTTTDEYARSEEDLLNGHYYEL
jgi:hypothetical protein